MPNYQIINSKISLGPEWKVSEDFKHKGEFVDSSNNLVPKDYSGHCYELVKYTRNFSNLEKSVRKIMRILLIVCSLGSVFLFSSLKKIMVDLSTKEYKSKRFKVLTNFSLDLSMICPDAMNNVLSYLTPVELSKCLLVSKQWQKLANQDNLWNSFSYPKISFDQEQWYKYFKFKVNANPPIPRNLVKLLESSCLIFKGKKIKDTHRLVLIPEIANDQPFNLEIFSNNRRPKSNINNITASMTGRNFLHKTYPSHWVLMSTQMPSVENLKKPSDISDNIINPSEIYNKYQLQLASLCNKFQVDNSSPNISYATICSWSGLALFKIKNYAYVSYIFTGTVKI